MHQVADYYNIYHKHCNSQLPDAFW